MPTASDELRDKMEKYFGDPIDDSGPYKYILSRGYTDTAGLLRRPSLDYAITDLEWDCIMFLCDEWDYAYEPTTRDAQ